MNIFNLTNFSHKQNVNTDSSELTAAKHKSKIDEIDVTFANNVQYCLSISQLHTYRTLLQPLIKAFKTEQIDPIRALAATSLSYTASHTGYDGWNTLHAIKFYMLILSIMEKTALFATQPVPPSVKAALEQLQEIENKPIFADKVAYATGRIQNLAPGESYTMPGGYAGTPGHAMLYRFKRTSDNTFNIYIYNSQSGSQGLQGGEEKYQGEEGQEKRTRAIPLIMLKDVTWSELFFSSGPPPSVNDSPILLQSLLSLQDPNQVPPECGTNNVRSCFAHLDHRRVESDKLPRLFISMQRSGDCTAKSMKCLFLELINNSIDYKMFSLDLRLFVPIAFYHYYIENREKCTLSTVYLHLLKESTSNFLRLLHANCNRKNLCIDKNSYEIACATIYHITQELQLIESPTASIPASPSPLNAGEDKRAAPGGAEGEICYFLLIAIASAHLFFCGKNRNPFKSYFGGEGLMAKP